MLRKDKFRLKHMQESSGIILGFIKGRKRDDLSNDRMLLSAIIRELEVIGEAAHKVSHETKKSYHLPWNQLVGMRNRLIHSYFVNDEDIIWQTITHEIPRLHRQIDQILSHDELK
jgi:uncharacterized protein with HEPN domain